MPIGIYKRTSKMKTGKNPNSRNGFKKGHIVLIKTKKKISKGLEGNKNTLGYKHTDKSKDKIRKAQMGEKSHFWKGGISTYERKLFLNARRRAKRKQAEGSHTWGEWELLKKQYGYICPDCHRKESEIKLSEDHIIPLSKGGSDYIENIQPLCRSCNSRKKAKVIKFEIQFLQDKNPQENK